MRRLGDKAMRLLGDKAIRRLGDEAIRRLGDKARGYEARGYIFYDFAGGDMGHGSASAC